jgi:hypothetical protein
MEDTMGRARSTHIYMRSAEKIVIRKNEGKRQLERLRCTWEINRPFEKQDLRAWNEI